MDGTLKENIHDLPGCSGWWKNEGLETFIIISEKLLNKGFTDDEVYEILEQCFGAVSEEFGE